MQLSGQPSVTYTHRLWHRDAINYVDSHGYYSITACLAVRCVCLIVNLCHKPGSSYVLSVTSAPAQKPAH